MMYNICLYSPEHAATFFAPAVSVVVPIGHVWQLGAGTVVFPPAEKVPALQSVQLGPPVPALQTGTAMCDRSIVSKVSQ